MIQEKYNCKSKDMRWEVEFEMKFFGDADLYNC